MKDSDDLDHYNKHLGSYLMPLIVLGVGVGSTARAKTDHPYPQESRNEVLQGTDREEQEWGMPKRGNTDIQQTHKRTFIIASVQGRAN